MKFLKIESTKLTPGIVLDPDHNVFEFFGFSLPENAIDFYQPVLDWLKGYHTELTEKKSFPELNVIFKLVYYNSSSLRQIVDVFYALSEYHRSGIPINISWQYDSEDPAMAESGKEIADITKVPLNVVAYN